MLQSKTDPGKRDRRITIRQRTLSKDEYNQDVETWSTLATVWAGVIDQAGGESYQSDQLTVDRVTNFDVRYDSRYNEQMRILFDSRFYKIVSIVRPDRKRSLILKTELLDET